MSIREDIIVKFTAEVVCIKKVGQQDFKSIEMGTGVMISVVSW